MASRISRLIKLIRILRGKSYPTVHMLCRALGIKERTFFNDLRELKDDLSVDVRFDKTRHGYYLENDIQEANFITLTEEAAFILLAAFELLDHYCGENIGNALRDVFRDEIQLRLDGLLCETSLLPGIIKKQALSNNGLSKEAFIKICRACLNREPISILPGRYAKADAIEEQLIDDHSAAAQQIYPWHLFFQGNELKLAYAEDEYNNPLKKVKLSIVQELLDKNHHLCCKCGRNGSCKCEKNES